MELEPDVDTALEWASSLLPVLQQLLDKPFDDHDVSKHLPAGGLRVAHVIGLVRLLNANTRPQKGPWLKHFVGRRVVYRGAALQVWLFHLPGGRQTNLREPTSCSSDEGNRNLLAPHEAEAADFTKRRSEYTSKYRLLSGAPQQTAEQKICELYTGVWLPYTRSRSGWAVSRNQSKAQMPQILLPVAVPVPVCVCVVAHKVGGDMNCCLSQHHMSSKGQLHGLILSRLWPVKLKASFAIVHNRALTPSSRVIK